MPGRGSAAGVRFPEDCMIGTLANTMVSGALGAEVLQGVRLAEDRMIVTLENVRVSGGRGAEVL